MTLIGLSIFLLIGAIAGWLFRRWPPRRVRAIAPIRWLSGAVGAPFRRVQSAPLIEHQWH